MSYDSLTLVVIVRDDDPTLDFLSQSWIPTVFACNMRTKLVNASFASNGAIYNDPTFYDNLSSTWTQWQQPPTTTNPVELAASRMVILDIIVQYSY